MWEQEERLGGSAHEAPSGGPDAGELRLCGSGDHSCGWNKRGPKRLSAVAQDGSPTAGPMLLYLLKNKTPTCFIIEDLENTDSIKKEIGLSAMALTRESRSYGCVSSPSFPSDLHAPRIVYMPVEPDHTEDRKSVV